MAYDPETYRKRKATGYYAEKRAGMTDADRAREAKRKRAERAEERGDRPTRMLWSRESVDARRAKLAEIAEELRPATVRQVFYQAEVRGLIPKTENGYKMVQQDLTFLRRNGDLDYDCLVDNTRRLDQPMTYDSPEEALQDAAQSYRKSLWTDQSEVVQIWLEKDALSGVVSPITYKYDVPLLVARGYASLSFLQEAAADLADEDRPVYVYHFGDHDPSGINAAESIDQTLREFAPDADIHFERVAVTMKQIKQWRLPTRPTKETDSRAAKFGGLPSVELDAIEPNRLRRLIEGRILRHLPTAEYERLIEVEAAERQELMASIGRAR